MLFKLFVDTPTANIPRDPSFYAIVGDNGDCIDIRMQMTMSTDDHFLAELYTVDQEISQHRSNRKIKQELYHLYFQLKVHIINVMHSS